MQEAGSSLTSRTRAKVLSEPTVALIGTRVSWTCRALTCDAAKALEKEQTAVPHMAITVGIQTILVCLQQQIITDCRCTIVSQDAKEVLLLVTGALPSSHHGM